MPYCRRFRSLHFGLAACLVVLLALAGGAARGALNLPARTDPAGWTLVEALPGVAFSEPVAVATPPGETNRLFVAERTGRVWAITNLAAPNKTLAADLRAGLDLSFIEQGLLGLAFHPGFATNGQVFFTRTARTATAEGTQNAVQLLRYVIPAGTSAVDPASQTVIFAQPDFSNTHNGGDLAFGPDGYLYVSCGDELPAAKDVTANRQPLDAGFFGGILRIDVDRRPGNLPPNPHPAATAHYLVPADNPFVGLTNYQGVPYDPARVCTEFWAVGFRNPWRMAFDAPTGRLFVGDVGGSRVEEVNLVERGGNYGWPYLEGGLTYQANLVAPGFSARPPLVSYDRAGVPLGGAVIGGLVYRGAAFPTLHGRYVFGDSRQGHIWAMDPDAPVQPPPMERLVTDIGLSAFGRDPRDDGVLVVNFMDGRIKKLARIPEADAVDVPATLAETGAFTDLAALTPAAALVPYAVNAPFWSDHALKRRWFVPVPGQPAGFHPTGNWTFPPGTAWVKHFELELVRGDPASRRRLETRFLVKSETGAYGVTYRWDDAQTNAALVPTEGLDERFLIHEGGLIRTQAWRYPSRAECMFCHSGPAGFALGFSTRQLNHVNALGGAPENQLARLHRLGCLDTPGGDPARLPALVAITNTAAPLEHRARSYLDANCSSCHLPGYLAHSTAQWDARSATRFLDTGLLRDRHLAPGQATNSFLLQRVADSLPPYAIRMPPVGSTELDAAAIALLAEWINALPVAPWQRLDLGAPGAEGSATRRGGTATLAGAGNLFAGAEDQGHALLRPLPRSQVVLEAALARLETAGADGVAGLMLRRSPEADAPALFVGWRPDGSLVAARRGEPGAMPAVTALAPPGIQRLRLVREAGWVRAEMHWAEGEWETLYQAPEPFAEPGWAGLGVSSADPRVAAAAFFEDFALASGSVTATPESGTAPAGIAYAVEADVHGSAVAGVALLANGRPVAGGAADAWSGAWFPAPAGRHALAARITLASGQQLEVPGPILEIRLPPAGWIEGFADAASQGGGAAGYGTSGWWRADAIRPAPEAELRLLRGSRFVWNAATGDPRALPRTGGTGIASTWFEDAELILDLSLRDGGWHRLAIYFLDWDTGGQREQTVEILDRATGALLARHELAAFHQGLWLVQDVRGAVRLRVVNRSAAGNAVLAGLYLSPPVNSAPEVTLALPAALTLRLPAGLALRAEVNDAEEDEVAVEFLAGGQVIGTVSEPPYVLTWTNLLAGTYELRARARDARGAVGLSEPVVLRALVPAARARFEGADDQTQGDWPMAYGREAAWVPFIRDTGSPRVPTEFVGGRVSFAWLGNTSDPRAPLRDDGGRTAACWVDNAAFTIRLTAADGHPRRVSLYCLDWDRAGREQRVEVLDAATGTVLDRREVAQFADGRYLTWEVAGAVELRVTARVSNAVISGLFVDPAPAAAEFAGSDETTGGDWRGLRGQGGWSFAGLGTVAPADGRIALRRGQSWTWAAATTEARAVAASSGSLRRAACWHDWQALELDVLLPDTPQPLALYFLDWDGRDTRVQTVELVEAATGRLLDRQRLAAFSSGRWLKWRARGALRVRIIPERLNAVLSGVALGEAPDSFASFVRQDEVTRGNWPAAYGGRGWLMPFEAAYLPDGAQVQVTHEGEVEWAGRPLEDRATLRPDGLLRRAACWKSYATLGITADLTASGPRVLTLYLLDWDGNDRRSQTVRVVDADSGRVLDERAVTAFSGGRHLSWLVGGRVRFELRPQVFNAVVSGIFLDPPAAPAVAAFAGEDTSTRGDWPGLYGGGGVLLAGDASRLPLGAAAVFRQAAPFVWHGAPADARAPWRDSAAGRVAACWYDGQAVTLDLTLPGDSPRPVALYFLDWDGNNARTGEVEVLDRVTGGLLDRRPLGAFSEGRHLAWNAGGPLRFRIRAATANAVLSGLFFGIPPAVPEPAPGSSPDAGPGPGPGPGPQSLAAGGRLSAAVVDGAFVITLSSSLADGWQLETATALEGPWQPVAVPAIGTAGRSVSLPAGDEPARFYRLRHGGGR